MESENQTSASKGDLAFDGLIEDNVSPKCLPGFPHEALTLHELLEIMTNHLVEKHFWFLVFLPFQLLVLHFSVASPSFSCSVHLQCAEVWDEVDDPAVYGPGYDPVKVVEDLRQFCFHPP